MEDIYLTNFLLHVFFFFFIYIYIYIHTHTHMSRAKVISPYKITEYTHKHLTGTSVWQYRLLERLGTPGYYKRLKAFLASIPVNQRIAWLYSDLATVHFVAHHKCKSLHGFKCWVDSSLLKGIWVTLSCFIIIFIQFSSQLAGWHRAVKLSRAFVKTLVLSSCLIYTLLQNR